MSEPKTTTGTDASTAQSRRRRIAAGAAFCLLLAIGFAALTPLYSRRLPKVAVSSVPPLNNRNPEPEAMPPTLSQSALLAQTTVGDIHLAACAVDRQIFHIVIAARDAPPGKPSPFVVETAPWSGATGVCSPSETILQTPAGALTLTTAGVLTLQDRNNHSLLSQGIVRRVPKGLELTFQHAPAHFYGSGNAGLGQSGGLLHTSGTSAVGNGYTRIPFVWSPGGSGVFIANNTIGVSWDDRHNRLRWLVPAKYIDLYLLVAPNPYAMLDAYARLTGRPPVPPAWTLGYLQSRWGYADAADVREKWNRFRALHIPVDAFLYDYDWFTDDWQFNLRTFPDPIRDLAEMHRMGLHFVGIRKPRVHGQNLEYARKRGWTLIGADLRFDLPAVQQWWSSQHVPLVRAGVDGWWNDEAETAYDEFFYMNIAERDSWRQATGKPFWSLNRAFAPGMQRLGAAVWTGDIPSTWQALQNQPGTLLNWSLCGMPWGGQDIGGFSGIPSSELYVRWMQEGALVPVMRAHGMRNSPRWPWSFGSAALSAARKAILLRQRLRPYLLACAQEASRTGAPIMRPLFFEFPNDPNTVDMEREWLIGRDLLAAPVLEPGGHSVVYLPAGHWRDFQTGERLSGPRWLRRTVSLDTIPIYVRASSHMDKALLAAVNI